MCAKKASSLEASLAAILSRSQKSMSFLHPTTTAIMQSLLDDIDFKSLLPGFSSSSSILKCKLFMQHHFVLQLLFEYASS
jgi:hypothetical protein